MVPVDREIDGLTLLGELADELGMDRSAARKFAVSRGFSFTRVRSLKTRGAKALALSIQDADEFRRIRLEEYAVRDPTRLGVVEGKKAAGSLYMIQLIPDIAPLRIKLGYSVDVRNRLTEHRTAAPTASIYAMWLCEFTWEIAAIASMTRSGCVALSNEVYDCDDIVATKARGDEFFALMPIAAVDECDDEPEESMIA